MTISQETKDFILDVANKQVQKHGSTCSVDIMMVISSSEASKYLNYEFETAKKITASILAEAHRLGNLIADTTVTTTTIYYKKLD